MKPQNFIQLLVLAALWGASFLFIRVGVSEFSATPLATLRIAIGAACLLGMLIFRHFHKRTLRETFGVLGSRAIPLTVVGILNSAAPFCLFAYAELTLSAGATSIFNATTPMWSALIAVFWLKDRLSALRLTGLALGFIGVLIIVWDQIATPAHSLWQATLAILAAIGASLLYGVAANYTKRYLRGVDALTLAAGSMSGATVVLLPFAVATWPAAPVSLQAWGAIIALGIACTGIGFAMYFHLLNIVGPVQATTVTFVVPIFGMLWGALFLDEHVSSTMVEGCAVVLIGTALASGLIKRIGWQR